MALGSLKQLNRYFYRNKLRLVLGIAFVALSNYFAVYSIQYVRKAIDFVKTINPAANMSDTNSQLLLFSLGILGMALLNGFFMFLMRQTIIVMSRLIENDMKNDIYEHYQKLDLSFYKRNNTGDLMNRISEDVSRVRMYIGPAIMYVVNTFGTFLFTIVVMLNVDVNLTIAVLLPLPILVIAIYFVSDIINKKSTLVQEQLSKLSSFAQETFSGIRVLKAYNREANTLSDFEKESIIYRTKNLDLVKTEALFQPFMILLIGLSTIITVYVGGLQAINGKISIGNIAEFILYVNRLTWPIASLGWVTSLIQRAAASQTRINEFLNTKPEIADTAEVTDHKIIGTIEFKNVSFTYPDSGIKALDNVSFKLKAGDSLAFIGKTGAGKSTIANLLCRMYDVDSGSIEIDGIELKKIHLNELRGKIGCVPQEVFLFSNTISNNIAFGIKKNLPEAVEKAAKDAVIYSNIMEFPDKFETVIGERGITLSGGQKQRISIARAIIKAPNILIFDDCLSAVDTETEESILNNLKVIMKDKSSIIISHRISSVKNTNQIIVLNEGVIAEEGNHAQLIAKKGYYYDIYMKQQLEGQISE